MTVQGPSLPLMKKQKSPMPKKPPAPTPVSTGFWLLKSEVESLHSYFDKMLDNLRRSRDAITRSSHAHHTATMTCGDTA